MSSQICYHLNRAGGFLQLAGKQLQHDLTIQNGTPASGDRKREIDDRLKTRCYHRRGEMSTAAASLHLTLHFSSSISAASSRWQRRMRMNVCPQLLGELHCNKAGGDFFDNRGRNWYLQHDTITIFRVMIQYIRILEFVAISAICNSCLFSLITWRNQNVQTLNFRCFGGGSKFKMLVDWSARFAINISYRRNKSYDRLRFFFCTPLVDNDAA